MVIKIWKGVSIPGLGRSGNKGEGSSISCSPTELEISVAIAILGKDGNGKCSLTSTRRSEGVSQLRELSTTGTFLLTLLLGKLRPRAVNMAKFPREFIVKIDLAS